MSNKASKVEYFGKVLIDLTGDSVSSDKLVVGATAHDKTGAEITGTNPYEKEATDNEVNAQAVTISDIIAALQSKLPPVTVEITFTIAGTTYTAEVPLNWI